MAATSSTGGLSFYIDGIPAAMLGRGFVGGASASWTFGQTGGGLQTAQFSLSLPRNYDHPALRPLKPVQVKAGPISLGWGQIGDVNRESGQITIDGWYRRGERFLSLMPDPLTSDLIPTMDLVAAVTQANLRGLGWNGTGSLMGGLTPDPEATDQGPRTVFDLLTDWCKFNNKAWYLDADNTPRITDWPTAVTHHLRPGVPSMPTADDGYVSMVAVRYLRDNDPDLGEVLPQLATEVVEQVSPVLGRQETWEDITDLGVLGDWDLPNDYFPEDLAADYGNAILDARGARFSYTEGVEVFPHQVATAGNVSPAAWVPLHGQRVRHYGARDERGLLVSAGVAPEWTVARCTYNASGDGMSRVLEPVGLAPRTLPKLIGDSPNELGLAQNVRRENF